MCGLYLPSPCLPFRLFPLLLQLLRRQLLLQHLVRQLNVKEMNKWTSDEKLIKNRFGPSTASFYFKDFDLFWAPHFCEVYTLS